MKLKPSTFLQRGKYKIVEVLGQGSFGITYLAEHTALGKNVCIKEFFMKELNSRAEDGSITGLSDGSLSYNYAQKFRKEARNLARLDHPNIVKVTDSFDENGTFYYVMEHIDGENLNDYLKHSAVSQEKAVEIIKQVAEALIYMHEKMQMLHLDLKPGNVMRRSSDGHIFLIDFGLSKQFDERGAPETSTTIGLGTAGYAPIEQANQTKNGDFRPTIDVYALGATLYKLLTRETPPVASDLVSDDELIAENLKKHNVSDSLASVVVNAMMPNVKKRIQTVKALVDSLSTVSTDSAPNEEEPEPIVEPGINNEETITVKGGLVHGKTSPISIDDEGTIICSSSNTPPNAKGSCENIYENPSSKNVDELCKLTGKSKAICEKALKQTNGNLKEALLNIQTAELFKKYGRLDLGIVRDTCKRYLESADGSLSKAEKRLKALIAERELLTTESSSTNSEGNFITEYLSEKWTIITDNVFSVIFYLIIFGGLLAFFVYTGEGYALPCLVALMLTSAIAWVLSMVISWLFDEDSGFVEVSKIVYGVNLILCCLLLGLCVYFNIDLSAETPILKGF